MSSQNTAISVSESICNAPCFVARETATSSMTAVLGRMATYSGKLVTWEEAVKSTVSYGPDRLAWDATPRSKPGADGIYPCAVPGVTQAF